MANDVRQVNVTIDGWNLQFPHTGLAHVCRDYLRQLRNCWKHGDVTLVAVEGDQRGERVPMAQVPAGSKLLRHRSRNPDYLDRWQWSREMNRLPRSRKLLVPYLYNYGRVGENVVVVPDLVYRTVRDYGGRDPAKPWWNFRGRLPFRPWVRAWEERRVMRARRLVTWSEFVKNEIETIFRIPSDRIGVVPLAVPAWAKKEAAKAGGAEKSAGARFALYVGGFAKRKNIPLLLAACAEVKKLCPDFRMKMVGLRSAITCDANLARAWSFLADARVVEALASQDEGELGELFSECAFCVYPSLAEGFGLPVLEAAAFGKVCICGDNSSLREVQTESRYRVASDSLEGWVRKLVEVWKSTESLDGSRDACLRLASRHSEEAAGRALATELEIAWLTE